MLDARFSTLDTDSSDALIKIRIQHRASVSIERGTIRKR